MHTDTRTPRRPWANALLLSGTILGLVAATEITLRLFAPQPLFAYRFSPETWWEPTPGASFTYARTEFRTEVTYNALGFRGPVPPEDPAPGTYRVLLIGDSYTEGIEVPYGETMPARLAAALEERTGNAADAINLGVSGFGTVQSIRRLDALGLRFAPDVVVYLASANDFADNVTGTSRRLFEWRGSGEERRIVTHAAEVSGVQRVLHALKDRLKTRFMIVQFIRSRLSTLEFRNDADAAHAPPPAPSEEEIDTMRHALRALRDRCERAGATLFASIVTPKTVDAPHSLTPAFEVLCEEAGIPFIDLRPAFRAATTEGPPPFFHVDGHWTATGHAVAAEALADALTRDTPEVP